ncbi:MAG TPA: precorrin-3B C(17)-methyltransferase, partial [Hyphomicrobium sp.]|nr:precorrin-3B C(17)-methyltransferase [Hyphomicrobium sp.]
KSWTTIEKRLRLAAEADFVIALYNPASKARPQQIKQAFEVLRQVLPSETLVIFARAVGRPDEEVDIATLANADDMACDMRTLVMVGSRATRTVKSSDGRAWVYTPRSERER